MRLPPPDWNHWPWTGHETDKMRMRAVWKYGSWRMLFLNNNNVDVKVESAPVNNFHSSTVLQVKVRESERETE